MRVWRCAVGDRLGRIQVVIDGLNKAFGCELEICNDQNPIRIVGKLQDGNQLWFYAKQDYWSLEIYDDKDPLIDSVIYDDGDSFSHPNQPGYGTEQMMAVDIGSILGEALQAYHVLKES